MGGFSGGHMGGFSGGHIGGFSGGHSMSMGSHFGGLGHTSFGGAFSGSHSSFAHLSSGSHMPSIGQMHHLSEPESIHLSGAHTNPLWSPYFSNRANEGVVQHHGFAHGLAKFFGFGSSSRSMPVAPPSFDSASTRTIASNATPVQIAPTNSYLNPYFHTYNPFFNGRSIRRFAHFPWWYRYPYFNSYFGAGPFFSAFSPWFLPYYSPPILFGYLDPFFYSSFASSMFFPYTTAFSDGQPIDPYFVQSDYGNSNTTAYDPVNDGWTPPTYDPNSGITDPDLVPFDMSLPPRPLNGSPTLQSYPPAALPSGWTP
jgi:hypothetical protein